VSLHGCSRRSQAGPRFATPETGRPNFAAPVAAVAATLGFDLMPWQRQVNRTGTEMLPDGTPVYRQVTVEVMRQQGKSIDVLSLMLARALDTPGAMWAYSAQTRLAGRRRMLDVWWPVIKRSPLARLLDVRRGYGSEAYTFANGSMIMLASGTEVSDHGDSLDGACIDEAWAQRDDTIEQAFKPAMLTRPHAQLWIPSAAGTIHSHYFKGKVDDGRARAELALTDTAAYLGWSAPDEADPADPETWWACMPALGWTITEETVAADFQTMKLAEFRRSYLCQWPDVADAGWTTIPKDVWMAARI
jgi:phage terminase large subunit-like protein